MPLYLGDKLISGRSRPMDAEPIENSLNLITSGGVKKYVDDKLAAGTISGSGIAIQTEEPTDTDVWIDLDDDKIEVLSIVTSFNGRDGEVVPEIGDYTAEMVGADASGSAASALASAKAYADGIKPTKTSQLTNDSGFITGYTETDPTVPAWAKAASKPIYTASEVGAAPAELVSVAYTVNTLEELHSRLESIISTMGESTAKFVRIHMNKAFLPFNGRTWLLKIYRALSNYVQVTAECYSNTANGSTSICYNSFYDSAWQEWAYGVNSGNILNYAAPVAHNQTANTITAGTFAGQVVANSSAQTYSTYLLRNTRLASSDTTPTVNGQICWTYG